MANILFVGRKTNSYFAEQLASEHKFGYAFKEAKPSIKGTTEEMLAARAKGETYNYIIYDLECFYDDAEFIAKDFKTIAEGFGALPIAYIPSFVPGSVMAQELLNQGIRNYVSAGEPTDLKDQLLYNVGGYYDQNERDSLKKVEEYEENAALHIDHCKTIGVAGTQNRIGASTQALQIIKYLQFKGYKTCYVELNRTEYLDFSPRSGEVQGATLVEKYRLWNDLPKHSAEKFTYNGIEMYSGQDGLQMKTENYDFYVYDYGSFMDRDFDRTAFLKDDMKIIVAGAKVQEFDYLDRFLSAPSYKDVGVILSFVPENEQEEVMKPIAQATDWSKSKDGLRPIVFAPYAPDPFLLGDIKVYEKLIPIEATKEAQTAMEEQKPKKKGFFRRKEK